MTLFWELPFFGTCRQNQSAKGVVTVICQTRGHEKLETWKFFLFVKDGWNTQGVYFMVRKIIFDNKEVILASLNTNSGGKRRNEMNDSLVKWWNLWRNSSGNRNANFRKFWIRNSLMPLSMCTKFQINQIILTLFSGMWDRNTPPPPSRWKSGRMPWAIGLS